MANGPGQPRIGGLGNINQIVEKVLELEGFTEEQQAGPRGDGPQS
jgi:hypothetical protein